MSFSNLLRNCSLLILWVTVSVQRKGLAEPPEQDKAALMSWEAATKLIQHPISAHIAHYFSELYSPALIPQSYTEIPQQHVKAAPCFHSPRHCWAPGKQHRSQMNHPGLLSNSLGCRSSWRSPSPLTRWYQLCPRTHNLSCKGWRKARAGTQTLSRP